MAGLIFARNKNCSKYSVNQGVDGLKTFQAVNNAAIILGFQLVACLHLKFGKIEMLVGYKLKEIKLTKTQLH